MDYEQLCIKYQSLLEENAVLKLEIHVLKYGVAPPFDVADDSKELSTHSLSDNESRLQPGYHLGKEKYLFCQSLYNPKACGPNFTAVARTAGSQGGSNHCHPTR